MIVVYYRYCSIDIQINHILNNVFVSYAYCRSIVDSTSLVSTPSAALNLSVRDLREYNVVSLQKQIAPTVGEDP